MTSRYVKVDAEQIILVMTRNDAVLLDYVLTGAQNHPEMFTDVKVMDGLHRGRFLGMLGRLRNKLRGSMPNLPVRT